MSTRWRVVCVFIPIALSVPEGVSGCSSKGPGGFDLGDDGGSSAGSGSGGGEGSGGSSGGLLPFDYDAGEGDADCPGGGTTSITGTVYDPAGKNPLYNVAVYVPASPLQPLPAGVPTGADACSCSALFQSQAITSTATAIDGTFTLTGVPAGKNVPLVLQVGKWRRALSVNVASCKANPQPDKSLTLPSTVPAGDTDDNMPDIAVSTGVADTLECLMMRIGLPASELVAGASTAGHVHIFAGGEPGGTGDHTIGRPQLPGFAGAPTSFTDLWATQAQLMAYDVTLLACEGGETYAANPPALEAYLNAGGRVFASHYQYAWFGGPIASGKWYLPPLPAEYAAPADWGTNLATWTKDVGGDENENRRRPRYDPQRVHRAIPEGGRVAGVAAGGRRAGAERSPGRPALDLSAEVQRDGDGRQHRVAAVDHGRRDVERVRRDHVLLLRHAGEHPHPHRRRRSSVLRTRRLQRSPRRR